MTADASALRALSADLRQASALAGERAREVVAKTAFNVHALAQVYLFEKGAIDTGATFNSVGVDLSGNATSYRAVIGPTTEYAPFIEEGTYRMPPRPFMEPAISDNEAAFATAMEALGVQGLE